MEFIIMHLSRELMTQWRFTVLTSNIKTLVNGLDYPKGRFKLLC
ncbi:MAG: hypothetical protein E6902_10605 [Paeniclostridium sordellii]|nr:hypothetical protein [Paeniclostridium sordellii]